MNTTDTVWITWGFVFPGTCCVEATSLLVRRGVPDPLTAILAGRRADGSRMTAAELLVMVADVAEMAERLHKDPAEGTAEWRARQWPDR